MPQDEPVNDVSSPSSRPHLDLRVLGQFLIIVETLNMRTAARRMGMSPPAVSQIVMRLEHEFGAALFERNAHGLRLTPAGILLRDKAKTLIELEQQTFGDLAAYRGQRFPKLRLSMTETLAVYVMAPIVERLAPEVAALELGASNTVALVRDFLRDEADVIISNDPLTEIPRLERHGIYRQSLAIMAPKGRNKDFRDLSQLARELPLIRFRSQGRIHLFVEKYLQSLGIDPPRRVECTSATAIAQIVESGLGWVIAPPLSVAWMQPQLRRVEWLPLQHPAPLRDIHLICGEGRFLDLPKVVAKLCRSALREQVDKWRGTPLEPCLSAISVEDE